MAKSSVLEGKIAASGVQNIKAPVNQGKKSGKATVKRGKDLRSGK
jgi:hypothetical protein